MTKEAYTRAATGLVRPFGFFDVFIIMVAILNLGSGTLLLYSTSLAFAPSYNFVLSLVIAGVMNLFLILVYSYITKLMPRSGGDYVFVSRTTSPTLGFANNFFFTGVFILIIAWNSLFMSETAVSASLAVAGATLNNAYLSSLASVATQPLWIFVVAFVTILAVTTLMILPVSFLKTINLIAFAIGIISVITWIVVLFTTPNGTFIQHFNTFAQPYTNNANSYQLFQNIATTNGMTISNDSSIILNATLVSLPVSFFTLLGATFFNYFSGEIKEGSKNVLTAPVAALIALVIGNMAVGFALFSSAGHQFMASISYVAFNAPANYTLPTAPYLPLMVEIASPNIAVVIITLVGMISWLYLIVMAAFLPATRNIFAWSFDSVISTRFSEVNPRTHTPIRSVILIAVVAILVAVLYDLENVAFGFTNLTGALNSAFIVVCIAAAIFPFRKKDMFNAQQGFVSRRVGGVPLLTIWAVLGLFSVLLMDYYVVSNPGYAGIPANLSNISLGLLLVVFIVGVIFFQVAKAYQKSKGLDLGMVYREVPPD